VQDATVTMAFGRRYGLVGRNGTGKTTLLRAMAQHQIKGIPENCQILHVEQEVSHLQRSIAVLNCLFYNSLWRCRMLSSRYIFFCIFFFFFLFSFLGFQCGSSYSALCFTTVQCFARRMQTVHICSSLSKSDFIEAWAVYSSVCVHCH